MVVKKILLTHLIFVTILINFYACTSAPRYAGSSTPKNSKSKKEKKISSPKKGGNSKVKHRKVMKGVSSFYAEDFHGKLTANGEVYDMYGVTAAHKTLPLNTVCRVTNLSNNKSLILRINDRGPYIAGRILDCSYGAAKKLDFIQQGTTDVKIEVIEWGDGKYMQHRKKPQ
jgi:rare lipoprotein A|tara:strand:- start:672 stop:1184 length:513 start_codon:yes stop_codon:yes gene_type:complete